MFYNIWMIINLVVVIFNLVIILVHKPNVKESKGFYLSFAFLLVVIIISLIK